MRCSPKRIVLAALALIVGAVLAVPTLLMRKAEAGGVPPLLEALADHGLPADGEGMGPQGASTDEGTCGAVRASKCGAALFFETGASGSPLPGIGPHGAASLRRRLDMMYDVVAMAVMPAWPHPQTIDRQRRYHLRP